jgi:glycosyltransferase involved in cell wall biosynthesis
LIKVLVSYLAIFPSVAKYVSGGEKHMMEVCKKLQKTSTLTVLTSPSGLEVFRRNGITIEPRLVRIRGEQQIIRAGLPGLLFIYLLRMILAIPEARVIRGSQDLIISFSHFLPDTIPAAIAKTNNTALILYIHHLEPLPLSRSKYYSTLRSFLTWISQSMSLWLLKRKTDLVFTNIVDAPRIRKLGFRMNISPMVQGVDFFDADDEGDSPTLFNACYIGRITASKGVYDLVEIWQDVLKTHPNLTLAIAGGGPGMESEENKLRRVVASKHLSNSIKILGQISELEKYQLMKRSELFLFPSYEEGWGIVIGEAMACGNAVVVYNLPAYAAFKNGVYRVDIGDKNDFVSSINILVENQDFRNSLISRARKIAQTFDWDQIVEKEIELFKELIERK